MMNAATKVLGILGGALLLGASGCASHGPAFGDAVRSMAEGQQYDAAAPHEGNEGVDGQKAARAVEAYRAPRQAGQKPAGMPAIVLPPTP